MTSTKKSASPYTKYGKRPYDYSHLHLAPGLKNGDGSTTVWPRCRFDKTKKDKSVSK